MDQQSVREIVEATHWPRLMAATALGMLALFLLVLTASALKSYRYIGTGITPTNTISVDGTGKVFAVPDTASFTVTVQNTAPDVQTAQSKTTAQGNSIVEYLKSQGIADTDIQTTDYQIYPQYEYRSAVCPAVAPSASGSASNTVYCPPGTQVLTGYQVSETLDVKVKDISKAGAILAGVGGKGASNVGSLAFSVADQEVLQNQARDKAIQDAQGKAQTLAKSLGVQLVGIVNFAENRSGSPMPIYAKSYGMGASASVAAPAPQIATGENTITDTVTLTYEIQ